MRMRLVLQMLCLLWLPPVAASAAAPMERGVAITDPGLLQRLDESGLSLGKLLGAEAGAATADLFALPSMTQVQETTDRDFNRYVLDHHDDLDTLFLFDRDALNAPGTRFDMVGIINRMDRAFVSPDACGEIRLIYRPIANHDSRNKDNLPVRLPMTLNLVMKAKPAGADTTCAELARRWLALADRPPASEQSEMLTEKSGALEWVTRDAIDRIEINVQIARASADANDFEGRADYLMKVFHFDGLNFVESPMENQIDVARIRADEKLLADFKGWLLDPVQIANLDRGAIVLPDRFLTSGSINVTPVQENPEDRARALFTEDEVVAALAKASANAPLQNLLSPAGFARRLDDMTCSGCHQTRAVGGFHFPGRERPEWAAGAVVAAASPHFFGDQERRRDVLGAFRDGRALDFSRGFSARPQASRSSELAGTTYLNGWGAVCAAPDANAAPDKSFTSWTCAEELTCQAATGAKDARIGFCFPKSE
ncbi:MAG TPA: hypothetical protein DEA80_03625 [Afipia sp.]|uniref:hypothetical protein n=2 Tax=Afipia TaxID=1033 RepID=UPI000552A8F4|nr:MULTISPECIES: hypothetical protein [unclassified Afipia]MAH68778.1 hypothetical protein [Afipia sp.]OUX62152.1 MAG: hypothetical protein CBB64_05985 [Afipia sp. TMED4]HAP46578.1 hypothetical protein [Afipia sp.]HBR44021.1 hypothetical protein [Afipia sp.]